MNDSNTPNQGPVLPTNGVMESGHTAKTNKQELPKWKVSGIFSSHMVLQREQPVKVWGWSSHIGAQVRAEWEFANKVPQGSLADGENVNSWCENAAGIVDENGRFEVTFGPRAASFVPTKMTICSEYGSDTFEDILVGDVWLIGGQSNAELNLEPCLMDSPEIAASIDEEHPIRLFCQTQIGAMECTQFHHTPSRDIIRPDWCWKRPGEAAAKAFSAIGYYLARMVQPKISVPVGMVMMCAGGACLRELMPIELAHKLGYTTGANVPVGGYFNTLISPLIGLKVTGQIFFQGESEGIWEKMAHSYGEDLAAFVEDERSRFGVDFAFYNIQLSSYREECDDYFPHLYWVRASQMKGLSLIPNSYLSVARDLGSLPQDADFAHSPHKYELTKRVAAQVLAGSYGIGEIGSANSPMPARAVKDKDVVKVTFDFTNGGLYAVQAENQTESGLEGTEHAAKVKGFSFMNAEGKEIPAAARILSEDTVCVEIPDGTKAGEVHYAMNNMAYLGQANLCGKTGLPVPAFAVPVECR